MLLIGAILLAVFILPDAWDLPVVALGAVVEIAETVFWVRFSQRGSARVGPHMMIGAVAVVVEPCRPLGRVRIGGELWRARCEDGAESGDAVRVQAIDGLTLIVDRESAHD